MANNRWERGAVRVALLIMLGGTAQAWRAVENADAAPGSLVAELQIIGFGDLDAEEVDNVQRVAQTLLTTAGIRALWRDCRRPDAQCDLSAPGRVAVLVRLRPERKHADSAACGEVVRDYRRRPVVIAYLPPHADLLSLFRFDVAARSNPALGGIRIGHLVGLTLAHEVGHWLGLSHAAAGVMKARPGVEEVSAMASQRLTFEARQGSQLRQALRQRAVEVVADNR